MSPNPPIHAADTGSRPHHELERAIKIVRRRAGVIAICAFGLALGALAFSLSQPKEYSATASLLFRNPGFADELFGTVPSQVNPEPAREAATNERLVGLRIVAERSARLLPGLSAEDIAGMIDVESEGEAELVAVTALSPKPAEAMRVANTFARQFIAFRADTDKDKLLAAKRLAERSLENLSPAERAGASGETLGRGIQKLGVLASLQTGNAELVQPADLPTSPSTPKPLRNAVLGGIVGLLLGIGLAFLLERLNRRLCDPEEAETAFGMPVLGTIPESKAIVASNEGEATTALPFRENEAFRMLRASLRYFSFDREVRSVLVTSDAAAVGKSTVAWNLAKVAARSGPAILVEADLRKPTLSAQHNLRKGPGLVEVLTHQVDLDAAIQKKSVLGSDEETYLDVIVSGALPPNPAELLESNAMRDMLSQLVENYELVVIDTAPLGVVADSYPVSRAVDGVVAVVRMEKTGRDSVERLREQLQRAGVPLLGIVANGIRRGAGGGRYAYGYYGREPAEKVDPGSLIRHSTAPEESR